mgnify:CR=1 FL=1
MLTGLSDLTLAPGFCTQAGNPAVVKPGSFALGLGQSCQPDRAPKRMRWCAAADFALAAGTPFG